MPTEQLEAACHEILACTRAEDYFSALTLCQELPLRSSESRCVRAAVVNLLDDAYYELANAIYVKAVVKRFVHYLLNPGTARALDVL